MKGKLSSMYVHNNYFNGGQDAPGGQAYSQFKTREMEGTGTTGGDMHVLEALCISA